MTDFCEVRKDQMDLEVNIERECNGFLLQVSFRASHKTLGILGPSGSGKSMTLRCIAGLEAPARGSIVLNGRPLFDSSRGISVPSRKRRVGFLMQDYALFPHMTVAHNIAFGLRKLPRTRVREIVNGQLERFQLQGLEARYPRQLSGGQQQRAAMARAMAIEPEILMLDEPLSALDVHLRSQMETLLVEALSAYRGVSLYVTHNLEEAYRISEEIVVLSQGREVAFGPKDEIFRHSPTFTVARVTGCKNFSRARVSAPGFVEALDWGCRVRVCPPIPEELEFIGVRAHHLTFTAGPGAENAFPCELVRSVEGPFRMTLFLRLIAPNAPAGHHHLQAEITRENWAALQDHPLPWLVCLPPERIMLLRKETDLQRPDALP